MRLSRILCAVAIVLIASVFIAPAMAQNAPLAANAALPAIAAAPIPCAAPVPVPAPCPCPCWAQLMNMPFAGGLLGHSCGCPFNLWLYNVIPGGCKFDGAGCCGVVNDQIGAQTWSMAAGC